VWSELKEKSEKRKEGPSQEKKKKKNLAVGGS
jgi:hypothetical protein